MKNVFLILTNKLSFIIRKLSDLTIYLKDLVARKELIILLGKKATYFIAYRNGRHVQSLFLETNTYTPNIHDNILEDFKSYKVSLMLDSSDVSLNHHEIQKNTNVSLDNEISQYLSTTLKKNELVEYKMCSRKNDAVVNLCISSMVPNSSTKSWIEGVLSKSKKFQSVHFLNLQMPQILNQILQRFHLARDDRHFSILVTITATSGIRIIGMEQSAVLYDKTIDYDSDKARELIKDTVNHEVGNCLNFMSAHLTQNEQLSVVFFVPHELQIVLQNTNFLNVDTIIVPVEHSEMTNGLMDGWLLDVLGGKLKDKLGSSATNAKLAKFTRFKNFLCKFFKPLQVVILCLFVLLVINEMKIFRDHYKMRDIGHRYFNILEQYSELKKQYPNINDFDELITFQSANLVMHQPQIVPFDNLEKIFNVLWNNLIVKKVSWKVQESGTENTQKQQIFEIVGQYTERVEKSDAGILSLKNDILALQRALPKFVVEYTHDETNVLSHGDLVYIPVKITIRQSGE